MIDRYGCRTPLIALLFGTFILFAGCRTIAPFDQHAYVQATELKVESLHLIARAAEPFRDHADDVSALRLRLAKAYEYERGRPQNELTTRMWQLLNDPQRNLLGGFLRRWEDEETLSPAFVEEASRIIARAFDQIIELEGGKIRPGEAAARFPIALD